MPIIRPWLAAAGAAVACALVPAGAQAGPIADGADCTLTPPMSQVFAPWADLANYALSPGGGFESSGAGWSLDGASVGAGNESYFVGDAGDASSLTIPAGGSATSAPTCVGLGHPTVRFFTRSSGTGLLSRLRVDVLFEDGLTGATVALPIGWAVPSSSWQPTVPMVILMNLLAPLTKDGMAPVAFRLTTVGAGQWRVDDFYVDPLRKP
jgi:hypothetical protein